jgi:hypothetical protein
VKDIPLLSLPDRHIAVLRATKTALRILENFAAAMQDWDDCQSKEVYSDAAKELVVLAKTCQRKLSRMTRELTWSDV